VCERVRDQHVEAGPARQGGIDAMLTELGVTIDGN
jgi:hypothetical protein